MKPGFLNEVTNQSEDLESFKQEKFVAVTAKKKPIIAIVSILVLVSLGLWFALNQKTELPNFVSWSLSDVNAWTESHDIQLVYKAVFSPQSMDTVISQDIEPGTDLSANSVITVEVSQGLDPDEVIVLPAFDVSWDKTQILNWLNENQLENYRFELAADDALAANAYVSYTLTDTEPFTRSKEIVFIINQSAAVSTLIMPDLSLSTIADIETWALSSDIDLSISYVFSDSIPADKFVSQSVLPNAVLESGSELSVSFSKGEAVIMADFRTMDEAEAKLWASLNNLTLSLETVYSSTQKGSLITQSVKAGTALEAKSKITVTYSLGSSVTIGSYVNASLPSFQSFIEAQNELGAQITFSITTQYSSTIALNRIIAINVSDEAISRGSTIEVIVSLGALVKVPDFSLLSTGDYMSTYNAILLAAKNANVTIRIHSIDDPDLTESELTITQSLVTGTLCSSADIIDLYLSY